ncbi:MAG: hydantoinase/oxoprolinase family protein, partial [Thermomicrobiales bacterium]|nr:hydantoinase/oxoprolinase family protein [Thermomicrobiales bacterium]
MAVRIGIDTGGTFTDLVGFDADARRFVYAKSSSTPGDPSAALTAVLSDPQLDEAGVERIVVGTTVATNAILQRSGARIVFITTAGFEDVPFIGRMDKAEIYNLNWKKPSPLANRSDCYGVQERVTHDGEVLTPLDPASLQAMLDFVRVRREQTPDLAVAVALLFSYVRPDHEWAVGEALRDAFPDLPISLSHEVAPIWREYERGSTAIGDAFVKPIMRDYVAGVRVALEASGRDAPVSMLKSNGGHLGLDHAPSQPAQFLLSGLAGGIVAARAYAKLAGVENVFSLDMGGTSADIGTIEGGTERSISEFEVGFGIPVVIPSVDVATLGAGGGSIAWIDKGGLLQVGPQSAGAEPG